MIRLNLLPPEVREEIDKSKVNFRLRQYVYYAVMVAIGIVALFAVVMFLIWTRKDEAQRQINLAKSQIQEVGSDFTKASNLSARIDLIKKIKSNALNWTEILAEIGKRTPANVQIENLTFVKADNRIKLTGIAIDDKDIANFKESLSKSEMFSYVDIESITKSTNQAGVEAKSFSITFILKGAKTK